MPLEKTRYANVSLRAGRTGMISAFPVRLSSISWEKLRLFDSMRLDKTNILSGEIPSSFATGSRLERSFSSTKRQVAFDNLSAFLSSKGFESAEIRTKGVVMYRQAWIKVM